MKNAVIYARFRSHAQNEQRFSPDYPDGNDENEDEDEKSAKEKETANAISLSGCSYTPRMVTRAGIAPCAARTVDSKNRLLSSRR